MKSIDRYLWLLFLVLFQDSIPAQDIEQTAKQVANKIKGIKDAPKKILNNGIKINGEIASTSNYFDSKLVQIGRIPFESSLRGGINFDFFGKVKMPFNFNLNTQSVNFTHPFDQKFRYRQPFNLMQLKPSYKGLTLTIGAGAASYSSLTLNGHRYTGFGIDFKPQKIPIYGGIMSGTLLKAVRQDSSISNNEPAFKRVGFGGQIGFKKDKNIAEIIIFRANDVLASLPYTLDKYSIFPKQNAVIGFKGGTVLFQNLAFNIESAISGITDDIRDKTVIDNIGATHRFFGLLSVNSSTIYKKAIKTDIVWKAKTYNLGLGYHRVDPEYRTLGAYYFTNDLENVTANFATQLFEGKLSLMSNIGRQRDNLDESKSQSLSQWVGSGGIVYVPSEKLNLNFMYSSFRSFTNLRTNLEYLTAIVPYNALDTLNYRQINQNIQGSIMKTFASSSEKIKKMLMANVVYQQSADKQGGYSTGSKVANATAHYTYNNIEKKTNFMFGVNIGRNDYLIVKDWLLGPTLSYGSSIWNKQITTQCNISYLRTWGNSKETSGILNSRVSANYTLEKRHNFSLLLNFMHRQVAEVRMIDKDFWQFMATLNYSYSFEALNTSK